MKNVILLSLLFLCATNYASSATRYWVGGTGNWSDIAHWSIASGGGAGASVPATDDDVFFDASSGLTAPSVVTLNIAIIINSIDFSGVATGFVFDSPVVLGIEFRGSIVGNVSGVTFTGTWPIIDMNTTLTGESITSGGTIWVQDFTTNGEMISLIDDFNIGTNAFVVDSGGVDMMGNTVTCLSFTSSLASVRTIDISNATITASAGLWEVDSTNLTWTSGGSEIFLGDGVGSASFDGGSLPYDILRSTTATSLNYLGNNSFDLVELVTSSNFLINNGDTLYMDSLIATGTCASPLAISTIGIGANGAINKTGSNTLNLTGITVTDVDAVPSATYNLSASTVTNATGWSQISENYYWIGGTGNWNDGLNWSISSGGPSSGCIPGIFDNVFFDASSGLTAPSVVTLNIAIIINSIDFSGVATGFVFDSPVVLGIEFRGSIVGNVSGVTFTGTWPIIDMNTTLTGESITSGGTIWVQDFTTNGEMISLIDDFNIGTNAFVVDSGGVDMMGNTVTCLSFTSSLASVRTIDISNATITASAGLWEVDSTNLTWTSGGSEISLGNNIGSASFDGGSLPYDTLRSTSATNLNYLGNNSFDLVELVTSSNFFINNGDTLYMDSLIAAGTCVSPLAISTIGAGANGAINKTGFNTLNLIGITVTDVDAVPSATYNLSTSTVTNGTGWSQTSTDYYWIGGTGNWNDGLNWSFSSGGPSAGCIPGIPDNVFFDASSGLTAPSVVTLNIAIIVNSIDFSGVATGFVFDSPVVLGIEFRGSIVGNVSGVTFTGTWPIIDMNTTLTGESITSGGTIWVQDFTTNGEMISLIDDFNIGTNAFVVDSGGVDMMGNTVTCLSFTSSLASVRTIDISNATITASAGLWEVDSTNLTWTSGGSEISLGNNIGSASFDGGSLPYDTLRSTSATNLNYLGNNSFDLVELVTSSNFFINNGDTLYTDSLIAVGTCSSPLAISTIGVGANGAINKTGFNTLNLIGISITDVDAVPPATYNVAVSTFTNATGWSHSPTDFYWVGNGGDWNDVGHWSFTPGGPSASCLPFIADSVYFDASSFTLTDQEVVVDDIAYFGSMEWVGIFGNQTLSLDSTMWAYGDVILHSSLTLKRNDIISGIRFNDQADLFPNTASVDCSFSIHMPSPAESLLLQGDLVMSDTSSVLMFNGKFSTEDNDLRTGSFITINDPSSAVDLREIDFGSSSIHFVSQFSSKGDTTLIFDGGTSDVYIGDTIQFIPDTISYSNGLHTEGIVFHDVTLNFQPLNIGPFQLLQSVTGANTFNKFEVIPGSHVFFDTNVVQIVLDSLILKGNCLDSIWLQSLDTTSTNIQASINKATSTDIVAECLNVADINYVTPTITTLFSTNLGNNTNWTFDSANSTDASYTFVGQGGTSCFGDTVFFTNTSTAYSGTFADLTSTWSFNDDTLGYVADTNAHIFNASGEFNVSLVTTFTNFCTDTSTQAVLVNRPIVYLVSSDFDFAICQGDSVTFEASSPDSLTQFQFFLNGTSILGPGINDTLYITAGLNDGDTISVQSFLNGCASDSIPQHVYTVNPLPVYTMTSTDADTTICAGDLVSFTGNGGISTSLYQYQLNGTNVTSQALDSTYSNSSLIDGDTVMLISETIFGCVDTSAMIFNVDPLPGTALTATELGTIICQATNVTFTASGASTYEFFVNGVSQGAVSATTTYSNNTLTATDTVTVVGYLPTGCSFQAPESFNYNIIASPPIVLASSDLDLTICGGDNVVFTASGGITYEFFIDGATQGAASPINNFSTTGITNGQIVTVVGNLGGCLGTSADLLFTVVTSPTTVLTSSDLDDIICQGESVTFTGTGATNYEFFVAGISQGVLPLPASFTTNSLIDGQIISLEGESNGCIIQDQLTYTVLPTPSINLFSTDSDNTICDGEPVTFTTANAASYQLYVNGATFGAPQTSPLFVDPVLPIGVDTLYVVGTAANGCSSSSLPAMLFTINPIPVVVNSSSDLDNIICAGELVTFTGSGSDLYQFYINGVQVSALSSSPIFLTSTLGDTETVDIVGSSLGCTSPSNAITMTVNTVPVVSLTNTDPNNIWCIDEIIDFNASGAPNYEFIVDGVSQGPSSPTSTINSSSFSAGSYVVQVIGEETNCFGNASMGIVINALPVPTLTSSDADDIICSGESVTYTAGGGATYEFFVDGVSQGIPSAINTFTSTSLNDTEVVSIVVTSAGACIENMSAPAITVNPTPIGVTLVSSDLDLLICTGDNITFTAAGAIDYEFFVNGVSTGPASTGTTFSTTGLVNGDEVELIASEIGCSSSPAPLVFTVYNYPVISLVNNGEIQICTGELTNLTASGASNYQFLVNGVPTGPFSPAGTLNVPLIDGDIVTVAGEANGCPSTSTDTYTFTVYDFPTLTSTSSDADNIICLDEPISFEGFGAMTYDFALNGNVLQSGAGTTFDINTLVDGDVISVTGFNGDCPSIPDTYTFTVTSMTLDLVTTPSNMICEGDAVTLTASGADTYEFFLNGASTGPMSATNTLSSSTFNDLDEITFTAFSAATGCTQAYSDYVIMNVIDEPSFVALSSTDFCEGDSVVLVSAASHGNQWYLDGALISGATDTSYVAYTSGVYSVETTSGGLGTVWSFGQNASGTIGNGENLNSADPLAATSTVSFDELTSGYDFVLGVTTGGDLYGWGDNGSGQLGDGTYTGTNLPQLVPTLTGIKTAATSESSAMAVTTTGEVYVWGNNSQGQLGTGNTAVINFPFLNGTLANTDSIAGGRDHFVILRNDGTVWAVGNNNFGQLGQGDLTSSMSPLQVPGLVNIVSVGAGEYQSFAIDNNGDLYVWGNNGSGQLGLGDLNNRLDPTLSGLKKIINAQGGASHSAFLSSENKVYTSGGNGFGQLGSTNYVDVTMPYEVNIQGASMISTGQYTTLVKRTDNSVFGFGNNTEDQLSSINGLTIPTPEHINDLDGAQFIEAGRFISHVIYNEDQVCVSPGTTVNMLTVPIVSINVNGDTLSTIAGVSYQWYLTGNPIPGGVNQTYEVTASGEYYVEVTFANGCTGTSIVHTHSVVGIEDLAFGKIVLYPNPVDDQVNLMFSTDILDNTTYVITDQAGRIVMNGEINTSNLVLNVSELESGMYNLIISNEQAIRSLRFVKSIK